MTGRLEKIGRIKGPKPGSLAAFGFGLFCFAMATLLRLGLHQISPDVLPFAGYFAFVLIAVLVAGWQAATLTALLGGLFAFWAFVPPFFTFDVPTSGQIINMIVYLVASTGIIYAAHHFQSIIRRLQDEENYRRLVVDELEHRVKNKLATIYAILNRSLQNHPDAWKDISGRLKALAVADEFITRSGGQGAGLRQILEMELTPYDKSRAMLSGPDISFSSRLAATIALIIHELATNAAKYGSLSSASGHVDIVWSQEGDRVSLQWREHEGPEVTPPKHRGFGTFLAQRALSPFDGVTRLQFEPHGFSCDIAFTMPKEA